MSSDGSLPHRWHEGGEARRDARKLLATIVSGHADALVASFYEAFLDDEAASAFLSHGVVQQRLHPSLCAWLQDLLRIDPADNLAEFSARQKQIGEVHARIKIPIHLVMAGASHLKMGVGVHLMGMGLDGRQMATALMLFDELVDHAMRLMSEAYVVGTARRAKVDEAYRLFSLGQDIGIERESQRAALMEWSQSVLFSLFGQGNGARPQPLSGSSFGLWLRHRAGIMFQGAGALHDIEKAVERIDTVLLPAVEAGRKAGDVAGPLAALQTLIDETKFLLGELFQAAAGIETGRDPLTRTLNRRFLPSILSREISLANDSGSPFAVLMIDVDHFKQINDRWGHQAGDLVLRQIADVILENVRLSDFVFRYGGEEFLVALVETGAEEAVAIADRIRTQFMARPLRLPDETSIEVTTSIGVAVHEGHPDYAYLIEAADQALYRAKKAGRNRCELAATQPLRAGP